MGIISYAQNFEDVLLTRVFANLNYGFYVDIGAYHPVEDSVTKAFYDRGWSGINIEPGEIFDELAAARTRDVNLNIAVYDRKGEIAFAQHPGWYAGLSHVEDGGPLEPSASPDQLGVETRVVACDTLSNILERHGGRRPIAFVKIDAEGAELAIIRSTNWRHVRPTVLLIEATLPLSTELDNQDWEPILLEQGYCRAYFDGINCFYVPEERSDLLRCFVLPVNVLDGFTRPEPPAAATLREELRLVHDELRLARERLATMSDELGRLEAEKTSLRDQNALYATTINSHDRILGELRHQFDHRMETAQAASRNREAELQAAFDERLSAVETDAAARLATVQATSAGELAAMREAWDRQVAFLQGDSEARIREVHAKCADLEQRLDWMSQQEVVLAASAMRLHRLIFELKWPDGPRALRTVLPLARIIRRLKGTRPPDALAIVPASARGIQEIRISHREAEPPPAPRPRRSLKKGLARLVYWPLRPVARPMAWRLRAFLIGETRSEVNVTNEKLSHLLLQAAECQSALACCVQALNRSEGHQPPSPPPAVSHDFTALRAELRGFGHMLETTLLTLALERDAPQCDE
jgi:FkbM family methyltransferase